MCVRKRDKERERGAGGRWFYFKRPFQCVPVYILYTYKIYKYFLFFFTLYSSHISRGLGARVRARRYDLLQDTDPHHIWFHILPPKVPTV